MKSQNSPDRTAFLPIDELTANNVPAGVDRRAFLMRSAVITSATVITGCSVSDKEKAVAAAPQKPAVNISPELEVVKKSKGPVMTVLQEFYKVGPGPSSSHTIGPMRITYDFYQRCTKLPPDQLAKATG